MIYLLSALIALVQEKDRVIHERDERISLMETRFCAIEDELKQVKQYNEKLQLQYKELQRLHFGSKGERYVDTKQPEPTASEEAPTPTPPPDQPDDTIEIVAHKRKRGGRSRLKNLPRREVIVLALPEERKCACGKEKQVIGYEINEILNYKPAVYEIIGAVLRNVRPGATSQLKYSF